MKEKWNALSNYWKGTIYANFFGICASVLSLWIAKQNSDVAGLMVFSLFTVVPVLIGVLSVKYLTNEESSTRFLFRQVLRNFVVILIWAAAVLKEGYICLLIVSPLIIAFLLLGAGLGVYLYNGKNNKARLSVFGTLLLIYVFDILSANSVAYEVSDTLIVNAPPSKVWPNVVAFDEVEAPSEYWLFDIGLPKVVAATVTERKVGGERKCVFENGIAFDEKIVVYEPEKNLTFDIVKMPQDPEIIGHINLKRGQFKLKDNGNGTTTLEGVSWYDLKVFPAWYYNIWAESITRNVHWRAMKHIKKLSER